MQPAGHSEIAPQHLDWDEKIRSLQANTQIEPEPFVGVDVGAVVLGATVVVAWCAAVVPLEHAARTHPAVKTPPSTSARPVLVELLSWCCICCSLRSEASRGQFLAARPGRTWPRWARSHVFSRNCVSPLSAREIRSSLGRVPS